jgi:hypothetical protein
MKIITKKPLTFGDKGDSITLVKDCLRGGNKTLASDFHKKLPLLKSIFQAVRIQKI